MRKYLITSVAAVVILVKDVQVEAGAAFALLGRQGSRPQRDQRSNEKQGAAC